MSYQKCPICNGTGDDPFMLELPRQNYPCPTCKGARILNTLTGLPPVIEEKHNIFESVESCVSSEQAFWICNNIADIERKNILNEEHLNNKTTFDSTYFVVTKILLGKEKQYYVEGERIINPSLDAINNTFYCLYEDQIKIITNEINLLILEELKENTLNDIIEYINKNKDRIIILKINIQSIKDINYNPDKS